MSQPFAVDAERTKSSGYVRSIGGELLSSAVAQADVLRFERLRRKVDGSLHWHFKQPKLALLRHGSGYSSQLTVDGVAFRSGISDHATITVLPANTEVKGEFLPAHDGLLADYSIVFLANDFVQSRVGTRIDRPLVVHQSEALANQLREFEQEADNRDNLFDLYAEGWACQTLVLAARLLDSRLAIRRSARGGVSPGCVRRVDSFIQANLDSALRLDELARVAGLSKHHFLRAFRQTTGETPHQYVLAARIREAKRMLAAPASSSMIEVAFACGFSNPQNFATSFRKATGLSPSKFRQQSLS
ncbi:AraC family transcriptional regulator [Caenimonas soli]|uniref:AraC family transcriptional regulator n=1 Tax=Caenimonas soli TaxID=2735555 RepID=UPI001557D0D9|nr:AraC family transcriptional regulator [Caenimonas soli]NPC59149.1 helix-turn-helix transcriptional regulator [Caenimonas soli]